MKKKDRELLFKELLKSEDVLAEFELHGKCENFDELRKSKSDLLRVLYESIESYDTSYSDKKLYERFTSVLNN